MTPWRTHSQATATCHECPDGRSPMQPSLHGPNSRLRVGAAGCTGDLFLAPHQQRVVWTYVHVQLTCWCVLSFVAKCYVHNVVVCYCLLWHHCLLLALKVLI